MKTATIGLIRQNKSKHLSVQVICLRQVCGVVLNFVEGCESVSVSDSEVTGRRQDVIDYAGRLDS